MSISVIAYKQRALILTSVLLAMCFGIVSFFTLPAREDPEVIIREAVISTNFPNMKAEDVERLVTRPLEAAIVTLPELDEVRSSSMDGRSIIHAKVEDKYSELDQIWDELAEAVEFASLSLPQGASKPVVNDDFGDVAVMTFALTSKSIALDDIYDVAQGIRDQLVFIEGTRRVGIHGSPEEVFYIDFNDAALEAFGLTKNEISQVIKKNNNYEAIGAVNTNAYSILVSANIGLDREDKLLNLPILIRDKSNTAPHGIITLGDVATVTKTTKSPYQQAAFFNGSRAVVLSVVMQPEQSVINYTKRLDQALSDIQKNLSQEIELNIVSKQSIEVEKAVYGVSLNVLQTLFIVLAVVMVFLGLRMGLIVGAIVPCVMLATLAVMGLFEMQLERMSLATLVIALGLLVDNGIVVAEQFKRRYEEHQDKYHALAEVGKELALPLLSSTATTVIVFIPLMMAEHGAGEFTRNISLVVLISLAISWLFAMTVTPTMCYFFVSKKPVQTTSVTRVFKKLETQYRTLLTLALNHKKWVILGALALFFVGVKLISSTPKQFFPSSERHQLLAYINTSAGSSTLVTEAAMTELTEALNDDGTFPYVNHVMGYVGFGGPRFIFSLAPLDPANNVGFLLIDLTSREAVEETLVQLRKVAKLVIPDVQFRVSGMFTGPSDPTVLQVQYKGPDYAQVFNGSQKVIKMFESYPDMIHIWSNWFNLSTRANISVNKILAEQAGISEVQVLTTISQFLNGTVVSVSRQDDDNVPVVLRGAEHLDVVALKAETIISPLSGEPIPLEQLITVSYETGFPVIEKEDGIPTVTIEGRNLKYSPEDLAPMVQKQITELNAHLPEGYSIEFDGIIADSKKGKAALAANFPLAFCIIVLILISQFGGFRRPIVILLTIPLVVFGAGSGLQLMGGEFGFIVILGLLALAGIIINNAIVLIDRADIERKNTGVSFREALVEAASVRMRPILITSITTIVGLLPLIMGNDVLFFSMAVAIAFGLGIGTPLTLFVIPVLYEILTSKEKVFHRDASNSIEINEQPLTSSGEENI
ncbi:efflux RND transporter permease subunit [Pseudoalteromonas sp. SCSIO 43201]|uniref:efflux RND transporter permease subunit n=1 Tax=Pseudoalteromonas sp. SCSIO 43201 TaxID=2822842 RepID=UPI0020765812|nr:efflux RND transporter permease subunit [Pseudoalteromonas sp. SCSIO 43201]USD27455.1 efflux RND transporter permease subunit [Pseudoalteromonas sp. SCSIO 43201]